MKYVFLIIIIIFLISILYHIITFILRHRIVGSFIVAFILEIWAVLLKKKPFLLLLGFSLDPKLSLFITWIVLYFLFPEKKKFLSKQPEFRYKDINKTKQIFFDELYDAIQEILTKRDIYPIDYDGLAITLEYDLDFFSAYGDTLHEAVTNFLDKFISRYEKDEINVNMPVFMTLEVYKYNNKKQKSEVINEIKFDPRPILFSVDGKICKLS